MHPYAAENMRCHLTEEPARRSANRKIALVRPDSDARVLENWPEIASVLAQEGFEFENIASLSFLEQVQVFREARVLFSVLGSGLSGLIYSPIGVQVCSVAPSLFGDRFFYAMVLDRRGFYGDVRGPVCTPLAQIPHRSPFRVNANRVSDALGALESRKVKAWMPV